jgi:hypothetical protein
MNTYKNYPINSGQDDEFPMNSVILEQIYKRFEYMTTRLSQCLLIRFDLHLPNQEYPCPLAENRQVSEFFNQLVHKNLKERKPKPDRKKPVSSKVVSIKPLTKHRHVQYFWVREIGDSEKAHYHCWIMLDRHITQSAGSHRDQTGFYGLAMPLWSEISGGGFLSGTKDNVPKWGLHVRNDIERDSAFYAISYLAKARDKGIRHGTKVRDFGGSLIPRNTVMNQTILLAA